MATDACREWRGDLAIEALGRLDEPARTPLLAHVDGCADCRAVLVELSSVATTLDFADAGRVGEGDPPRPSRELGERILGRLQRERAEHRRRRTRGVLATVVGVAAAAAVALVLVVGMRGGDHGTVVALRSPDPRVHAQAVLFKDTAGTRVRLRVNGLDDGEWYWLWVTGADGKRVAAGTFAASGSNENLTMTAALSFARTQRVWVTDVKQHVVLDGFVGSS
jgi:Anti-sigma-K factor rskA